jgi:hypothetical protein
VSTPSGQLQSLDFLIGGISDVAHECVGVLDHAEHM